MIKKVTFIGRAEAERLIGHPSLGIISIRCSDDSPADLKGNWGKVLRLTFDDIEKPLTWEDPTSGTVKELIPFNADHAKEVMDFLQALPEEINAVVVHCYAGISRSAAVAKYIATRCNLKFNHGYHLYNHLVYATLRAVDYDQRCEARGKKV